HPPPPPPVENCPPACPPPPPEKVGRVSAPNPIPAENQKPGEPTWRSGRTASAGQVELYTSTDSAVVGDTIQVKVSTSQEGEVSAEVFRMGYYGGAGARKVWSGGPFKAGPQAACPREPTTSLVECAWTDTFSFPVGEDWVSGVYLVKVKRADGYKRFAPFVVRDARAAEILFQPAFMTYQAYNTWGGESLYSDDSGTMPNRRAYSVSFNRPYRDDEGAGQLLRWELPFLQFLEKEGYDVTYATNLDFLRHDNLLDGIGAFVHGGHDEYWAPEQRAQVDAALASGKMSLAHFGGNAAYWKVRMLTDSQGQPLRTMVCFKNEPYRDPVPFSTVRFRDEPNPTPENGLFGTMYDGWQLISFPLTVKDERHWLFEGTGLKNGMQLHGLLGYEVDRIYDNGHTPPGLSISMESPLVTAEGVPTISQVVDRTLPSGRLVFSAGTIYWPLAFTADPELADARVVRMTQNVLERALKHRRAPRTLAPATGAFPSVAEPNAIWAAKVEAFAGVVGQPGHEDGPASKARFNGPTGLAVLPGGEAVVADTGNNRIRLIERDAQRTVSTIAGNGEPGGRDGPGATAMFRRPIGVAVGPDGAIYVADSDNHAIRRLTQVGPVWVVTTYAGALRAQGQGDGEAEKARFNRPTALAIDAEGNLFVADQAGNRIRKIEAGTRRVSTVAGTGGAGWVDAPRGKDAKFNNPSAIVVGAGGELYVLDAGNQRIRRISADADRAVQTLAGKEDNPAGYADGPGKEARFRAQLGMTLTLEGDLLVADTANFRIRKVSPGADAESTQVFTVAGTGRLGSQLGTGDKTDIVAPTGLTLNPALRVLVSDSYNHVIRIMTR
ncbi:MAG TPA: N,N-dimethylformamidase beta subunit family domain-containing protein, partial [Myxococcaceae bacterium]